MKFAPLFGLRVRHDYYPDSVCRDLLVEPSAATRRLIAGCRLRVRELPDGIDVAAPLGDDDKNLLTAVRPDDVFTFELGTRNPDFVLFTDPRDLPLKPVELRGDRLPAKPLEIRFRAKAARWAYYVLTDRTGIFSLVDLGSAPLAFGMADLGKKPDESDAVAADLSRRYPGLQRLRFLSDQPVPCSSAARKGLELHLGKSKVLDAIPGPSIRHLSRLRPPGARSGSAAPQDTLHQIVKYLKAD